MAYELQAHDSHRDRHDKRVVELITHLAAEFIARETNGTSLITATRAELSPTGERATIFVSVFPTKSTPPALEFLNRNTDEFRNYLKSRARMRDLPRVTFVEDYGERNRQHLDELGANP
jgi:ribosome-binding factor A